MAARCPIQIVIGIGHRLPVDLRPDQQHWADPVFADGATVGRLVEGSKKKSAPAMPLHRATGSTSRTIRTALALAIQATSSALKSLQL
jgi:hypothetical protein